jgi:hypothetical protein
MKSNKAPVNGAIIGAVSRVVDDAQSGTREPSGFVQVAKPDKSPVRFPAEFHMNDYRVWT